MHTIFATLCQTVVNSPSLKLSIFAFIDDRMTIGADSRRANVGDMKKINNHIDPLNIQCACSPSLQLYARKC